MKRYLLVYSNGLGSRQKIVDVLNHLSEVKGWRYDMPNSFYLFSESSAADLLNAIRSECGGSGRCLLVEINHYYGWLPKASWTFFHKFDSVYNDEDGDS